MSKEGLGGGSRISAERKAAVCNARKSFEFVFSKDRSYSHYGSRLT